MSQFQIIIKLVKIKPHGNEKNQQTAQKCVYSTNQMRSLGWSRKRGKNYSTKYMKYRKTYFTLTASFELARNLISMNTLVSFGKVSVFYLKISKHSMVNRSQSENEFDFVQTLCVYRIHCAWVFWMLSHWDIKWEKLWWCKLMVARLTVLLPCSRAERICHTTKVYSM